MKFITMGALAAAQIALAAQPLAAAELPREPSGPNQVGTFAGARMRVPLGATREKAHAGLAFTATQRAGETGTLRFSKGMELGFSGDEKIRLSLAGTPVSQLRPGRAAPTKGKAGVSTLGYVAIGVGVVLVATLAAGVWFVNEMNEPHD